MDIEYKICSKCGENLPTTQFHKLYSKPRSQCKECRDEYDKKYLKKNKKMIQARVKIYYEKNMEKIKERSKKYRKNNKDKINKWRQNNTDKKAIHDKKYRKNNKEKINARTRARMSYDSLFKLKDTLRGRLKVAFKQRGMKKNSKTEKLIGCTFLFAKQYIENQFQEGMTWENYGRWGWHVDHRIPLASAKTEEELYKLFHYSNLQPLWALDNLRKSAKMPEPSKVS